jgi:hypothetical protein
MNRYRVSCRIAAGLTGLLLTLSPAAPALASCGSANCFLVSGVGDAVVEPGQTVVDLSYRYIPQDVKKAGSGHASAVLVPKVDFENGVIVPDHHLEYRTVNMLAELDVTYGLTPNLTLAVAVPFMNDRLHEHVDDVGGADEAFVNTDGTAGFGDVAVGLRYAARTTARAMLTVGAGVKLPTGEYKLRDRDGGINEPTLMPGTGSFDYRLSAIFRYLVVPERVTAFLSGSTSLNTENDLDYRRGDAVGASAGATWDATERIDLSAQVNARRTGRDKFLGMPVPSTGATYVFVTPGIRLDTGAETSLYAHVQVPVHTDVNEVNLVPRYALQMGVTHSF